MSYDQHDMFWDRLNALPLSVERREFAVMVLGEISRAMPEPERSSGLTAEELAGRFNLPLDEVNIALGTLEFLAVIEQDRNGPSAQFRLKSIAAEKSADPLWHEISAAIHSHTAWKQTLRLAVDSGIVAPDGGDVGRDDLCPFGKWLQARTFNDSERGRYYDAVCQLHTQFHRIAAITLYLAVSGKKAEAEQVMSTTGPYAQTASRLIWALSAWRRAVTP